MAQATPESLLRHWAYAVGPSSVRVYTPRPIRWKRPDLRPLGYYFSFRSQFGLAFQRAALGLGWVPIGPCARRRRRVMDRYQRRQHMRAAWRGRFSLPGIS